MAALARSRTSREQEVADLRVVQAHSYVPIMGLVGSVELCERDFSGPAAEPRV